MLGTYAGNKKSSYLNAQSPRPYLWAMTRTVRLQFPSPLIAESNALWVHPNATNPEWRSQYMYSRSDTGCEKHKGLNRVPSLEIREFMHCKRHVALLWADLQARHVIILHKYSVGFWRGSINLIRLHTCTECSLSASRALVASSKIRMDGSLMRALAIAIRCFWPPLNRELSTKVL